MANHLIRGTEKGPPSAQPKAIYRAWLYRENDRRLFEGDDAVRAALADGWVDDPAKARGLLEKKEMISSFEALHQMALRVIEESVEGSAIFADDDDDDLDDDDEDLDVPSPPADARPTTSKKKTTTRKKKTPGKKGR